MTDVAEPLIDSRASFVAALTWGCGAAIANDARQIVCVDAAGFADWPFDDPDLLQRLAAWLRLPQRRLVLLAASFDAVPARWPRFNRWRADWAHAIDAWVAPPEMAADLPCVLVADRVVSVQLIDAAHWRGRASLDRRLAHRWSEEIDVVLQRSARGYAVNTLGL